MFSTFSLQKAHFPQTPSFRVSLSPLAISSLGYVMNHAPEFRVFTNSILGHVRVGLSTVFTESGEKSGGSGEKVLGKKCCLQKVKNAGGENASYSHQPSRLHWVSLAPGRSIPPHTCQEPFFVLKRSDKNPRMTASASTSSAHISTAYAAIFSALCSLVSTLTTVPWTGPR